MIDLSGHGSIPASAGERPASSAVLARDRVYPRERGGTVLLLEYHAVSQGLSPRARGNARSVLAAV